MILWSRFLVLALIGVSLSPAQVLSLDQGSVRLQEPPRIVHAVQLRNSGVQSASLQWSFHYDERQIGRVLVEAEDAALAAGKTVRCSSQKTPMTCIVWGLNRNVISDGVVAKITFFLKRPTYSGPLIYIVGGVASSPTGESLSVQTPSIPIHAEPRIAVWKGIRYLRRHRVLSLVLPTAVLLLSLAVFQVFRRVRNPSTRS
jgi:hypothetical protein